MTRSEEKVGGGKRMLGPGAETNVFALLYLFVNTVVRANTVPKQPQITHTNP
jgi:hypothetical protein